MGILGQGISIERRGVREKVKLMKQHTIKTYSFSELNEEAQKKALENNRNIEVEGYDWWQFVYEDFNNKLEKMGFDDVKMYFSGFSNQGDGASFQAKVDILKWLKYNKHMTYYKAIVKDIDNCRIEITKSGHYEHEMTMNVDTEYYGNNKKAYDSIDTLANEILEDARDYARQLYKELENEYDHLTSDECIKEMLEANDYEFLEDGNQSYYL